ncbi:MAG TPA: response regulator, partial [Spirochaetia bacterium]|nr:response regulator [Spirochaetia bacterium]
MKSVVIVDDDEEFRESLAAVLREAGYDVTTTATPRDALQKAPKETPHVFLVDVDRASDGIAEFLGALR